MRRSSTRKVAFAAAVGCGLLGSFVGCTGSEQGSRDVGAGPASVHGSDRLTSTTLADWVSFGDHLAVMTVVAEEESARTERDGGLTGRTIDVRVSRPLWSRAGTDPLSPKFSFMTLGSFHVDGKTTPATIDGDLRFEVGSSYLLILTKYPEGWGPLGPVFIDPGAGKPIRLRKEDAGQAWAREIDGLTPEQLGALLAKTPPDPIAAKYLDLDPDARADAVRRELYPDEAPRPPG